MSDAATPSRPESNGDEGVLHIPQISKAGASQSDLFIIISRTLVGMESYLSAEMQSVFSTVPADLVGIRFV